MGNNNKSSVQIKTTISKAFKSNVCCAKVLMHDDIIDFKSNKVFSEYAVILNDKSYQDNNVKNSKVMWSEIKQLKFSKDNPNIIHDKYQ